jgi:hypothetical protein
MSRPSCYTDADAALALRKLGEALSESFGRIFAIPDEELEHSLLTPADEEEVDEVSWPDRNPPERRKDSEISNLLELLDNLPTGKDSK